MTAPMTAPTLHCYIDACFLCQKPWGECVCHHRDVLDEDNSHEDGFDFDGIWITDPCVSECSRFLVDPYLYYGSEFERWLHKLWIGADAIERQDLRAALIERGKQLHPEML